MNRKLFAGLFAMAALILASVACSTSSLLGNGNLLEDNFSNNKSGWGTGTDKDSSVEYVNGGLQMKIFKSNFFIWSTPATQDYEKVHIEVTVINNHTDSKTAFGIMCDQQTTTSDFYYLAMTPAGQYAIAKAATGQSDVFLTNNDKWAKSDLITQDASSYRLGADCGNGTLTLYVGGQKIASASDSTYTKGNVGVFNWSGEDVPAADVTVDDFVMTKLAK